MKSAPGTYRHTQSGPFGAAVGVIGLGMLVTSWFLVRDVPPVGVILLVAGLAMIVLSVAFYRLDVEDEGDALAIRFGPLPLFRRRVPYATIRAVRRDRTAMLDGWGIHYSIRGGWVWNIRGRDCVVIETPHGRLWLGTDDADELLPFLESRI